MTVEEIKQRLELLRHEKKEMQQDAHANGKPELGELLQRDISQINGILNWITRSE